MNLDQITLETPQFNANEKKNTSIVSRILHRASDIEGSIATSSPGEESVAEPISLPPWSTSTKIEALLESLNEIHCTSTPQKSIVFSQFTSFLDILEWRLKTLNIQCVRLDGRMGKEKRDAVVKAFMNIPQIAVFL